MSDDTQRPPDRTGILYDPSRIVLWLDEIGYSTRSTTWEGLLEDFAAAGGLDQFGYTDDDWSAAYAEACT